MCVFSQNEQAQRGSIPEELLRPRREEAPRYPVDTVIGALGQGQAPKAAYDAAKNAAAALLQGNTNALVLSAANVVFLEGCVSALSAVNPRAYRLGSGREEPDGSYSFLVRFIGREQGMAGELFVRFEELRSAPRPAVVEAAPVSPESDEAGAEDAGAGVEDISAESEPEPVYVPPQGQKVWLFEDLILEEPRTREAENTESRHRFDFPPYERFF